MDGMDKLMGAFVSKPVQIEAVQFTSETWREVFVFTTDGDKVNFAGLVLGEGEDVRTADETDEFQAQVYDKLHDTWVNVAYGQWIIRGLQGEYYPCDPDVFAAKYLEVTDDPASEEIRHLSLSSSADSIKRGAEMVIESGGVVRSQKGYPQQGGHFGTVTNGPGR
jgi:hypothetical protein